jgi:hypothetical protein
MWSLELSFFSKEIKMSAKPFNDATPLRLSEVLGDCENFRLLVMARISIQIREKGRHADTQTFAVRIIHGE